MKLNLVSPEVGRITTIEKLLKASNIDPKEWEITKAKVNSRNVAMNKKDWTTELTELFQIFAELKVRHDLLQPDIKQVLLDVFWWAIPTMKWPVYKDWPLLANLNLADTHYGRINEGNPKKYLKSISDRTLQLFEMLLKHKPDKVLLAQLWDFYDSEMNGATTSGKHAQHLSIKPQEMFKEGLQFHIELIKTLASELPTDVIINHWNHDRNILFQTGEALDLYFNNTDNVKINNSEAPRKYMNRWDTKLWFSHWDGEKQKDLLKTFANENWLGKFNYHTRGHYHEAEMKQLWPLEADTLASTAQQSDRERNKFADKPWKLVAKLYDKKRWLVKKLYN